jgi:hypothetical protein
MRWKSLGLVVAVAATVAASAPAVACAGKSVFFRDNFTAIDPGWGPFDKTTVAIGGGTAKITPPAGHNYFIYYRGDVYDQASACVDAAVGGGSNVPDGESGLIFADEDFIGYYYFWVSPKSGTAGVVQWSNSADKYLVALAPQKIQGLGAKNSLGVTISGTKATLFVNDRQISQISITAPKLGGFFGLGASSGQAATTWTFQNFDITSVP